MYQQAKKNLKVQDHILIFEDSINGVKGALEIGADVVAIDTPVLRNFHHPNIKAYIQDYQDILSVLESGF